MLSVKPSKRYEVAICVDNETAANAAALSLEANGTNGRRLRATLSTAVSSLRIHATRATFGRLPAPRSRWRYARSQGLKRTAIIVGIQSACRNRALPSGTPGAREILRFPDCRRRGATPT